MSVETLVSSSSTVFTGKQWKQIDLGAGKSLANYQLLEVHYLYDPQVNAQRAGNHFFGAKSISDLPVNAVSGTNWYVNGQRGHVKSDPNVNKVVVGKRANDRYIAIALDRHDSEDTTFTLTIRGHSYSKTSLGLDTFEIPALAMRSPQSNGAEAGKVEDTDNSSPSYDTLDFDGNAIEVAEFRLPRGDYSSGIKFKAEWTSDSSSGNVVWGASAVAIGNDEADTTNYGTEVTVTDGVTAANDIMTSPESGTITVASAGVNDAVFVKIRRVATNSNDTMTGDARLSAVVVEVQ